MDKINESEHNSLTLLSGDAAWLPRALLAEYNSTRPIGPQQLLCHAPFKNIYFGHHGRAIACCYNRTYTLGEYPKQSIKEIWFGKPAEKLRDYIRHNNLSSGCMGCHSQLSAGNFDAVKTKQYDELPFNGNKYPSVIEFELSNVCNLECVMCSGNFSSLIRRKREQLPEIPMSYDEAFVGQLDEFIPYLNETKFYGGEPFLIDIYYRIWDRIIQLNPNARISVQTNATIFNKRVESILKKANVHINISLDSLIKETYEGIRVNAKFDHVMENLNLFYDYCKTKNTFFGISTCLMRNNWREAPAFIEFCNRLDVAVYFHTVFHPKYLALLSLGVDELNLIADTYAAFDPPSDTPVQRKNRTHFLNLRSQVEAWKTNSAAEISRVKVPDLCALKMFLFSRVNSDKGLSDVRKGEIRNIIHARFNSIAERVTEDVLKKSLDAVNLYDPNYDIDNMIRNIVNLPLEQLIEVVVAGGKGGS